MIFFTDKNRYVYKVYAVIVSTNSTIECYDDTENADDDAESQVTADDTDERFRFFVYTTDGVLFLRIILLSCCENKLLRNKFLVHTTSYNISNISII